MEQNNELLTAWDFVENTGRSIFLTGKAGTGKTTFLKMVVEQSRKRPIVVAPTGVAAINAGGVTIHSFFQLHNTGSYYSRKKLHLFKMSAAWASLFQKSADLLKYAFSVKFVFMNELRSRSGFTEAVTDADS